MNEQEEPKKRSWLKTGCLSILALFGATLLIGVVWKNLDPEGYAAAQAEAEAQRAIDDQARADEDAADRQAERDALAARTVSVTAPDLFRQYAANEVAAQQTYDGKMIEVTGEIARIELDFMDKPTVSLVGPSEYETVSVNFTEDGGAIAGRLQKGQSITVLCEKISEAIGMPLLMECEAV